MGDFREKCKRTGEADTSNVRTHSSSCQPLFAMWCHWWQTGPFSAALAQDVLAECNQPGKNRLKNSAMAGN